MKYILPLLLLLSSCNINSPSNGQKIGRIVKLEKKGFFSKTWEGELIRGGFSDGSGSMGNVFYFTIENPKLIDKAFDCLENQKEVVLTYEVELISSPLRSEEGQPHFIKNIEIKYR